MATPGRTLRTSRWRRGGSLALGIAVLVLVAPASTGRADTESDRPNVLILVTDDQTYDTFTRDLMPNVFGTLVDGGVNFTRAYVNSALCCPSRSEILTGLYGHHTGVDLNDVGLTRPTFVAALHDLGYRTGLSGKYLNSYGCDPPLPEFDRWFCQGSGKSGYHLVDPTINVDGEWVQYEGYTTDILAEEVASFIAETPEGQPFFSLYTPTSPHLPADDPRCADLPAPTVRTPSFDEDTLGADKPEYLRRRPLSSDEIAKWDEEGAATTRAVTCLDGSIGTILSSLGTREDDTIVFFLSDHGFLFGEHRWEGKMAPYEEAVHVPFVVRYPRLVSSAATSDALVSNVDIVPTIADILGLHWGADGLSLVPVLSDPNSSIRVGALIEHCEGESYPCTGHDVTPGDRPIPASFWGVVTDRHKYVEYVTGEAQLFDLEEDPYELANLAGDPSVAEIQADLAAQLAELSAPPPPDTTIVSGPEGPMDGRAFQIVYFSQSRFATYECRLDVDGAQGMWTPCNGQSMIIGSLLDGSYEFLVRATDENGVTDPTPEIRPFTIASAGPPVTIDAAPMHRGTARSVTFAFSSSQPDVTFECSLTVFEEPASWSVCSGSVTYGPLDDGDWEFEVRASGQDGSVTDPAAEWLFEVDNAGPVATFTRRPAAFEADTSADFAFYSDEALGEWPACRLDGASVECADSSASFVGLAESAHTFAVRAIDVLGNAATTSYTWTVDVTVPAVVITGGPSPSWPEPTASFDLSSTEPEGAVFGCSVDIDVLMLCEASASFDQLLDGAHVFTAYTLDRAGNPSATGTWSWTQDTVAPTVTILSGPAAVTKSTTATISFTATEPATFSCTLDGTPKACSSPITFRSLVEGPHAFTVLATDPAGNASLPAVWSWTIDRTPPVVTITSGPTDPTSQTSATFEFSADETGSTYRCSLDGARGRTCASPKTYSGLALGVHTFVVMARDPAGNVATASWSWTIQ